MPMESNVKNTSLHPVLWLWIPLLMIVGQIGMELILSRQTVSSIMSENGPHEYFQAILSFLAFFVCVVVVLRHEIWKPLWLAGWIGIAALGSFYIFGEELSWGQQLFKWATPDFWMQVNDQKETNLHNTSAWLDQKPRLLLTIGVFVGGLIVPLVLRYKPAFLPGAFALIYPPAALSVTAMILLFLIASDKLADALEITLFMRTSEVQEIYLYYFVFLYMLVMKKRIPLRSTAS